MSLTKLQKTILYTIIGSFLFCFGLNFFITPLDLYSGGIIGFAQVLRTLIKNMGFTFNGEISGYINFIFNIPLLILAYKGISHRFFALTICSIGLQTLFLAVIPVLDAPLIEDLAINILIGAFVTGVGVGLVLRGSSSAGGIDILGIYLTQHLKHFSVGKLNLAFNAVLYLVCFFLFDIETVIYSLVYIVFYSFIVDRIHYQNIAMTALIFTKSLDAQDAILKDLHRGITYWQGLGAYTHEDTYVMVCAINKYEQDYVRHKIHQVDSHAFIIFLEASSIDGNFEKHL